MIRHKPRTVIKIASNLYEESLYINVPGIVLEPKERGGEVTLQQSIKPCIIVDVGEGNSVTIKNTRMLLKGVEVGKKVTRRYSAETKESQNNDNSNLNATHGSQK